MFLPSERGTIWKMVFKRDPFFHTHTYKDTQTHTEKAKKRNWIEPNFTFHSIYYYCYCCHYRSLNLDTCSFKMFYSFILDSFSRVYFIRFTVALRSTSSILFRFFSFAILFCFSLVFTHSFSLAQFQFRL